MSIKQRINRYLNPVDYSTEEEEYSAEELKEAAEEVLGKTEVKTLARPGESILPSSNRSFDFYTAREDGVVVNAKPYWREAYDALEEAADKLETEGIK